MTFESNGYGWRVERVAWSDPVLVDRTGSLCVATTDPKTLTVYVADWLEGAFLARVVVHEITHAVMWSNGLVSELRGMTEPREWVGVEEWVCNLLADYGTEVFEHASKVLGAKALDCIPAVIENALK